MYVCAAKSIRHSSWRRLCSEADSRTSFEWVECLQSSYWRERGEYQRHYEFPFIFEIVSWICHCVVVYSFIVKHLLLAIGVQLHNRFMRWLLQVVLDGVARCNRLCTFPKESPTDKHRRKCCREWNYWLYGKGECCTQEIIIYNNTDSTLNILLHFHVYFLDMSPIIEKGVMNA